MVSSRVEVTQGSFFFTTTGVVEVEVSDVVPAVLSEMVSAAEERTDFLATWVSDEGGGVARWRVAIDVCAVATSAFQEDFSDQDTLNR